jgi:hypothetical protein
MQSSFDYAVIRVVPRVEREEFVNAGVILYSKERNYLCARVHLDESRLVALSKEVDLELVRNHLDSFVKICRGDSDAGPIAVLPQRERFHWLASPRSAMIQVSAVHSGLSQDPSQTLDQLLERLVLQLG